MIHKIQGIHKKQGGTGRPGDNGDAVGTSRPGNTRYGGIQGIEGIDGIHEIQGIQGIQVFRGFTTIVCSWIDMVETSVCYFLWTRASLDLKLQYVSPSLVFI